MNDYFDQITEAIVVGRGIDAFDDEWSRLCVEKWERGIRDPVLGNTILSKARTRQAKIRSGEVIPFRRPRFGRGKVLLGGDLAQPWHFDGKIWLPTSFFSTPWMVAARSGHGKSVLEANLALELAKQRGPKTWQLSCLKKDLIAQLARFRREGLELAVVRAKDLKYNPLHPGRNDPRAHLTATTSRLAGCLYDLPPRAELLLRGFCHEAYMDFGIFNGQSERFPTLFYVYEKIRTGKGLNIAARDALLDRFGSFLERFTPGCGAWLKGWIPTDLARHSILFLLWQAGQDQKDFVLQSIIDHVFQHQVESGVVNAELQLCIFLDDAQTLVNRNGTAAMSSLDQQVARNRGAGISIIFFTQTLHGVSAQLLPNINGLVVGRTMDNETRLAVGRVPGMTDAQIEWATRYLQRGWWVGIFAEGDWHEPFVFESQNVDLAEPVTEEEILESQRPLAALPIIPDVDFQHWERHPLVELQPDAGGPQFSAAETRLLELVTADPDKPAGVYSRKLGLNGKIARAARQRLVQLGLLREYKVQLKPRGKPALVLSTVPGTQCMNSNQTNTI
jgi:hypothetical protein